MNRYMINYYVLLGSRSHTFLLERRMKDEGITCEICYIPREIMTDLCNVGVKFDESQLKKAVCLIHMSGLPGCSIFQEIMTPTGGVYSKVNI